MSKRTLGLRPGAFSTGIGIEAQAPGKLERLCRYVSRPAWPRSGSRSPSAATCACSLRAHIAPERRAAMIDPMETLKVE
jgi:hypothetical protein